MSKTHSYDYIKIYLSELKIILCQDFYKNGMLPLSLMCEVCGYKWNTRFSHIKHSESRCPNCSGCKKITYEDTINILDKKNLILIGNDGFGAKKKLNLQCKKCGFCWNSTIQNVKHSKYGCHNCANVVRRDFVYVNDFLFKANIELLDNEYDGCWQKLSLRCMNIGCHHKWKTSFALLKNKETGCPKCAGVLKYTIDFVRQYLDKYGIELIDNVYKNAITPLNLRCKKISCQYIWKTKFDHIKNQKSKCPKCSKRAIHTIEFVRDFLLGEKIELMDELYINNQVKLNIKCLKCQLCWQNSFASLYNGHHGCPNCNKKRGERITGEYLKSILGELVINNQFRIDTPTLKNKNFILVDYYFELNDKKYIVEYNGEQHYRYVNFFHRNADDFTNQQKRDRWLKKYCKKNNIELICINGLIYYNRDTEIYKILRNKIYG